MDNLSEVVVDIVLMGSSSDPLIKGLISGWRRRKTLLRHALGSWISSADPPIKWGVPWCGFRFSGPFPFSASERATSLRPLEKPLDQPPETLPFIY